MDFPSCVLVLTGNSLKMGDLLRDLFQFDLGSFPGFHFAAVTIAVGPTGLHHGQEKLDPSHDRVVGRRRDALRSGLGSLWNGNSHLPQKAASDLSVNLSFSQ